MGVDLDYFDPVFNSLRGDGDETEEVTIDYLFQIYGSVYLKLPEEVSPDDALKYLSSKVNASKNMKFENIILRPHGSEVVHLPALHSSAFTFKDYIVEPKTYAYEADLRRPFSRSSKSMNDLYYLFGTIHCKIPYMLSAENRIRYIQYSLIPASGLVFEFSIINELGKH